MKSFFAPACNIQLSVDGPYEILFDPTAEPGKRGGEGLKILAIQPKKMLSFTWNAPPEIPEVQKQRTHVVIRLDPLSDNQTRVSLAHDGWGDGGELDQAFNYFTRAWLQIVPPRLRYRFTLGPIDWNNLPKLEDLAKLK